MIPLAHLLLAFLWTILVGPPTLGNAVVGFVVGFAIVWIASAARGSDSYAVRVVAGISLGVFTLREVCVANLRVAYYTVAPLDQVRPAILEVPLAAGSTDLEITLLANLVTLTPGTFTIDVAPDRRSILVHAMHAPDPAATIEEIRCGFERRIWRVTRGEGRWSRELGAASASGAVTAASGRAGGRS
jgi:multicomponent Na+:H+ antiporter subunit E